MTTVWLLVITLSLTSVITVDLLPTQAECQRLGDRFTVTGTLARGKPYSCIDHLTHGGNYLTAE